MQNGVPASSCLLYLLPIDPLKSKNVLYFPLKSSKILLEYSGMPSFLTNGNTAALIGAIEGLRALKEPCEVDIVSDSSYVTKGINEWLSGWIKRDFKKVKNIDLWKDYIEVSKIHKVNAIWVRGHDGHEENERCDELARGEAEKMKESLNE